MAELTVPDVIHRVPPLVEEARRFLKRCRRTTKPRVTVWRGPRRGFGAVYPGSFDPWTLAHEAILRAAMRRVKGPVLVLLDLETIDKPSHAAPLAERLAVLALHFAEDPRVAIGVSTHGRFLEKARALGRATFVLGEDTHERVLAPRYYEDPERELAELGRRARFLVAPRGGRRRGDLALSRVDQARSATLARRAFAAGRLPWDQLAPDVLLACWQLRLYGVKRLMPVWVVTAFLEDQAKLLLVKRGQRVGTYRGAWSGVSGYLDWPVKWLRTLVDCGPGDWALRQVLKEVQEETGIAPRSLRLVNAGRELVATDLAHRRDWRICPFLFRTPLGVVPKLDWENTACEWFRPWEVSELSTVPRLMEALERACGGWRAWFARHLGELARDRIAGAISIASRFLDLAADAWALGARGLVVPGARRLESAHPMAPLVWLRTRLQVGRAPLAVQRELGAQCGALQRSARARLARACAIATYGFSSTVLVALIRSGKAVTVLPDPDGHGRRLHANLVGNGVSSRLARRPQRDAVMVVGADSVLPDGSIINARGTANAIREAGLPVVVLAQRCKFIDKTPPLRRGFERVPAELLKDAEFITG